MPGCCEDGWKVTMVGSCFLRGTELRYAAMECKSLAITWGLEQTNYFTLGCDNLLIVTDAGTSGDKASMTAVVIAVQLTSNQLALYTT